MGDGNVNQTFTANITDLENKLAQAERATMKLTEANKKLKQESQGGHDEFKKIMGEQVGELTGMVTKYFAVGAAVGFVTSAYEKQKEMLNKVAEANEKYDLSLAKGLTKAGLLANAPIIEQWAKSNIDKGFTREQSVAAIMGAASGAPTASFRTQRAIAESILPLAPVKSPDELQNLGETVGRMSNFMPGKKPEEISNMVQAATAKLKGEKSELFSSRASISGMRALVESGAATPEQAMAIQSIAIQSDLPASFVEQIAGKIIAPPKITAKRGHLSDDDVLKRKFAEASPSEKLKYALENPEMQEAVLGNRILGRVSRIDTSMIDKEAAALEASSRINIAKEKIKALEGFEAGKTALDVQGHSTEKERFQISKAGKIAYYWQEAEEAGGEINKRMYANNQRGFVGYYFREAAWAINKQLYSTLESIFGSESAKNPSANQTSNQERLLNNMGATEEEILQYHKEMKDHFRTGEATNAAQAARVNGRE